jgi:hypothetical protein
MPLLAALPLSTTACTAAQTGALWQRAQVLEFCAGKQTRNKSASKQGSTQISGQASNQQAGKQANTQAGKQVTKSKRFFPCSLPWCYDCYSLTPSMLGEGGTSCIAKLLPGRSGSVFDSACSGSQCICLPSAFP